MGIFKEDLSVKEYVHQSVIQRNLMKAKTYGNRDEFYEPVYIYLYPEYKNGNPSNKTYFSS